MLDTSLLLSALLIGLLGGSHCIGMCGGIAGALSMGLPEQVRARPIALLRYLLAYNAGRLSSYVAAGAIAGGLGGGALGFIEIDGARQIAALVAALFLVALGVYLIGWTPVLAPLEKLGGRVWRYIEPLGRRFLPPRSTTQALALGLVWGWLPCGMVYSVLVWALTTGSAAQGALVMLAFGLGTLPTLLAVGAAARSLQQLAQNKSIRRIAGALVVLLALYSLQRVLLPPA
jgi:hypothetical protein